MDVGELIQAHRDRALGPTATADSRDRSAEPPTAQRWRFEIEHQHWDELRQACPQAESGLLELHDRLSRQLFR